MFLADVGPRHEALEEKQGAQMEHVSMKSVNFGCEICDFWVLWGHPDAQLVFMCVVVGQVSCFAQARSHFSIGFTSANADRIFW